MLKEAHNAPSVIDKIERALAVLEASRRLTLRMPPPAGAASAFTRRSRRRRITRRRSRNPTTPEWERRRGRCWRSSRRRSNPGRSRRWTARASRASELVVMKARLTNERATSPVALDRGAAARVSSIAGDDPCAPRSTPSRPTCEARLRLRLRAFRLGRVPRPERGLALVVARGLERLSARRRARTDTTRGMWMYGQPRVDVHALELEQGALGVGAARSRARSSSGRPRPRGYPGSRCRRASRRRRASPGAPARSAGSVRSRKGRFTRFRHGLADGGGGGGIRVATPHERARCTRGPDVDGRQRARRSAVDPRDERGTSTGIARDRLGPSRGRFPSRASARGRMARRASERAVAMTDLEGGTETSRGGYRDDAVRVARDLAPVRRERLTTRGRPAPLEQRHPPAHLLRLRARMKREAREAHERASSRRRSNDAARDLLVQPAPPPPESATPPDGSNLAQHPARVARHARNARRRGGGHDGARKPARIPPGGHRRARRGRRAPDPIPERNPFVVPGAGCTAAGVPRPHDPSWAPRTSASRSS